jgi:hypothetical protein
MKRSTAIGSGGLLLFASVAVLARAAPVAEAAGSPSAIGNQAVQWLAVSPAYAHSGLVVALATPLQGCSQNCVHLWVSQNGGSTWSQSPANGWQGGRPVIGVDGAGHDVLVAASGTQLQTSTDAGNTWTNVAPNGTTLPAIAPSFASDGAVAVANPQGHDYVFSGGANHAVGGSGGAYTDLSFMYAPTFPSGGHFAPALLSGQDSHSQLPVVEQCNSSFSCSGATTLAGSTNFSAPATLIPSTDYANDGTVFAQSGRGIYKSTNGGAAFSPLALVPSNGAEATATPMLALAPGYKEGGPVRTAYAAVFQVFTDPKNPHSAGGVYQTTDGGASWHALGSPSPLDGGVFSVAVAPDGRLFAGYTGEQNNTASGGLLCSQDGGQSWQAACSPVSGGPATPVSSAAAGQCTGNSCPHATPAPASPAHATPSGAAAGGSGSNGGGTAVGASASASGGGGGGGVSIALVIIAIVVVVLALAALYLRGYTRRRAAATPPRSGSPHGRG